MKQNNKSPTINFYIKIPKNVICSNEMNEHRVMVLAFIHYCSGLDNRIYYSPNYMLSWANYSTNIKKRKNNIYDKYSECMGWYFKNGYILNYDSSKYITDHAQESILTNKCIHILDNYGAIFDFEFEKIRSYSASYNKLSRSILLLLLSYIRAYTVTGTSRPEVLCTTYSYMGEQIGVSRKLIAKAIDELIALGLITMHKMSRYQDIKGVWHTDNIILACPYKVICSKWQFKFDEKYDCDSEIDKAITLLKNKRKELYVINNERNNNYTKGA